MSFLYDNVRTAFAMSRFIYALSGALEDDDSTKPIPRNSIVSANGRRVTLVMGGTGHIGQALIQRAAELGHVVYCCTRDPSRYEPTENIKYLATPGSQIRNKEFWKKLAMSLGEGIDLTVINAIGAPVAPKGMTLAEVNVDPMIAAASALKELEDGDYFNKVRFVHLSSIAAIMLTDEYGETKRLGEQAVKEVGLQNLLIMRVGYVFQEALEENGRYKIDLHHAYSPEQLASCVPYQPILGNGDAIKIQPVFLGDIVTAGFNFDSGTKTVDAVGREVITESDFVKFFVELRGGTFRPKFVSLKIGAVLAKNFPMGHLAPYAIEGCDMLEKRELTFDAQPFIDLIGDDTKNLENVYGSLRGESLDYATPPVVAHALQILSTMATSFSATKDGIWIAAKMLQSTVVNVE